MKKIYILFALAFAVGTTAEAQRVAIDTGLPAGYEIARDFNREVTDTLSGPITAACDATPTLFTSADGFVLGGNEYGDLEKAVFIQTETSGLVYSGLAYVAAKLGGSNENFSAKLYNGTLAAGPTTAFATSSPVNYADIDTVGNYTTFAFDTPQEYDGSLYLSFEVSQGDAIYGIVSTTGKDCGNGALWELWDDNTWGNVATGWQNQETGQLLDIAMYAFLEVETGSTVGLDDTNLIERGSQKVFPNPANESAQLVFSLVEASDITVRVYSTTGVLVDTYEAGKQNVGLNSLTINTQDMSQGHYIYSIQTDAGVRNGKFAVIK